MLYRHDLLEDREKEGGLASSSPLANHVDLNGHPASGESIKSMVGWRVREGDHMPVFFLFLLSLGQRVPLCMQIFWEPYPPDWQVANKTGELEGEVQTHKGKNPGLQELVLHLSIIHKLLCLWT